MIYTILPPILIVLSLVGIVLILTKKAPQIAELAEKEKKIDVDGEKDVAEYREKLSFSKKIYRKFSGINWGGVKNFFLVVLEKMARRSRLIFLKLENILKNISDKLRKSRKKDDSVEEMTEEKSAEEEKKNIFQEEEKEVRPFVSEKVVSPRTKVEMKDRLEEILIDRIAVNPKDIEAYERLGEYYMEINNYDHAKECYKQVMKLDPTNKSVRYKIRRLERIIGG